MGGCCTKMREDQAAAPAAASPAPVILTKEQQAPQLETFESPAMPPTEFEELEATTAAPAIPTTGQQLENPEATAPNLAVPTAGQLKTATPATTPDLQAPFEAPDMPLTEEQAAKRAAQLERLAALPEHLRLGVTLAGMRELLKQLPSDAVKQVNANIPLDKETGKPKFPRTTWKTATSTSSTSPSGKGRTR